MIDQLLKIFILFFVVIEPISLVPAFGALTEGASRGYRTKMACKATMLSAIIFVVFAFGGDSLLKALGISVNAFKIGGGLLLFMIAVEMVFARHPGMRRSIAAGNEKVRVREDISVFPMAFPLIAGPGALATLLLVMGDVGGDWALFAAVLATVFLVLLIALALMLATPAVMRGLGATGAAVIARLLGVILVALAVQYVVDGIGDTINQFLAEMPAG